MQKNGNSTVVVTASEMTDYDETNFVIQFKSKQTNEVKQCNVVDISNYRQRYNLLTIKDTTNPIAANGEVNKSSSATWLTSAITGSDTTCLR